MVLVGSANQPRTIKNPWTWEERGKMIEMSLPLDITDNMMIRPLYDKMYNDHEWVKRVQDIISSFGFTSEQKIGIIGYSKDEMIGRALTVFFDEDNQNILKEQIEIRRIGEAGSYELTWTGKDGHKIPAIISSKTLYAPDGSYDGSFAVVTDITERKQAEETLKESEERFREVVENIREVF